MPDFPVLIGIFSFIIGTIFGSFITALVYRVRHERSMKERHSVCPHCQHPLHFFDLFPIVSYIWLRGKCRYCANPVSVQYPLIELATGLLFAFGAILVINRSLLQPLEMLSVSGSWVLFSLLVLWFSLVLLIALAIYDARWGELPNQWTLGGSALMLAATLIAWAMEMPLLWQPGAPLAVGSVTLSTILSGVIAGLFFMGIVVFSEKILRKPGMGMGDVKLAVFLGLLLGFPGIVVGLYLAFIFGAVISLLLIAGKRKKIGNTIPFGPFMIAGALLALWLSPAITEWYSQIWL